MFTTEGDITRSDLGFSLIVSFREVIYVDDHGRLMQIPIEYHAQTPPKRIQVFPGGVNRWTYAQISFKEKKEIIANVKAALEFRGWGVVGAEL